MANNNVFTIAKESFEKEVIQSDGPSPEKRKDPSPAGVPQDRIAIRGHVRTPGNGPFVRWRFEQESNPLK